MDEEQRGKAERIKALLAGYYGSGGSGNEPGAPGSEGGANAGSNASDGARAPLGELANAPPATLDSPAFNAEQHISHILKSYPLEKLMIEHRNMAREIKNLDSDMQQLVYENYNKFISATDTIRAMKTNVNSMGGDMAKLNTIMGNVAVKSSSLSDKLQARGEDMEELQKVQLLLRKLQTVFDLPKKMRAALEEDVLDTAVSFYAEAQPLLRKYGGKGTFRQIAAESDQVAREISQVLKRRLTERKDSEEQCVLLLRKLGEPDDTLQDKYLQGRSARLKRILKDASIVVDVMAACASGQPVPTDLPSYVEAPGTWGFSQDGTHPPSLRAFVKALDEKVINAMQETVLNVLRFFLQEESTTDPTATASKRKPLVSLAREVFAEYFKIAKRALADAVTTSVHRAACLGQAAALANSASLEEGFALTGSHMEFESDWGADALAQALSTLYADLSLLNSNLPELRLKEHASELVQQAVFYHLHTSFSAVQMRVQGTTNRLRIAMEAQQTAIQQGMSSGANNGGQMLKMVYAYASEVLDHSLAALMQGLRAYDNHTRLLASWHDDFMDAVQGELHSFFLSLLLSFMNAAHVTYDGTEQLKWSATASTTKATSFSETSGHLILPGMQRPHVPEAEDPSSATSYMHASSKHTDSPKPGLILLLTKLCTYMEQHTLPWVMETLANSFVKAGPGVGRGGMGREDLKPAFVPGELARKLAGASSALLGAYVELHGRQLSLMVRRSVASTQWLHHKEPRAPRPVCDLFGEKVSRAEAEVGQLVEESGRSNRPADERKAGNSKALDAGIALETGNVERSLARIFKVKVKVFREVQLTQANILASIIGVGLKSLVECIRLQTLGRAGLQQLQLDCHYLRPLLRRFTGAGAAQVVDSLLEEVVNAGVERSVDPSLLEPAVLDRILRAMEMS